MRTLEFVSLVLLASILAGIVLPISWQETARYFWALALGGGVGVIELLGRYREEPVRALTTPGAIVYIMVNAAASGVALMFIMHPPVDAQNTAPLIANATAQVAAAGFGALALLRTSLFRARVGDTDVPVGPAILIDTLLGAADRDADRRSAEARSVNVFKLLDILDSIMIQKRLPLVCLALLQNLPSSERTEIDEEIGKHVALTQTSERDKALLVALAVARRVGWKVVHDVAERLALEPKPPGDVGDDEASKRRREAEELARRAGVEDAPPGGAPGAGAAGGGAADAGADAGGGARGGADADDGVG